MTDEEHKRLVYYVQKYVQVKQAHEPLCVAAVAATWRGLWIKGTNSMGHFERVLAKFDDPLIVNGKLYAAGSWPHKQGSS